MLFDSVGGLAPDQRRGHETLLVSDDLRYVPPGIDVDATCFIAEKGTHFKTDPSFWHKLARTVDAVSVPGTHQSILGSERDSLAKALAAALKKA
jgi:hypothetical protein